MSKLTLKLLGREPDKAVRKWRVKMRRVTDLLVAEYGTPSLGNFRDPVKEIFYIALSAKTNEKLYKAAYRRLWSRFSDLQAISTASEKQISECVKGAGLGRKRAPQLKAIATRLLADLGENPNSKFRLLSADECFNYLCSLEGIGPKSAFCVMMYSLSFDVFPVDTHVQRILCRMGAIRDEAKSYQAQSSLPSLVPEQRSKALHVALVVHGRLVCKPRAPECELCILRKTCMTGLRYRRKTSVANVRQPIRTRRH